MFAAQLLIYYLPLFDEHLFYVSWDVSIVRGCTVARVRTRAQLPLSHLSVDVSLGKSAHILINTTNRGR